MLTLYDHISATSKTAFRKMLRTTLEEQFAQTAPLIDALCKDMCADTIYPGHCLARYKDIECVLREASVARFDKSGNAKALQSEASNKC